MNNEFGKELKSAIDEVVRGPDADKSRIGEIIADVNKRQADRLASILLPHQLDRLKQISFQRNEQNRGISSMLLSKEIAEELGIDEEQQEKLKQRAEELKKEFDEKVAALKSDMRKELLQELTPEQRQKIDQMTGDKYEFKEGSNRLRMSAPGARVRSQRMRNDEN
jgi:hypothetical protein